MPHSETLLELSIFDEVRRKGGYIFPEGLEKIDPVAWNEIWLLQKQYDLDMLQILNFGESILRLYENRTIPSRVIKNEWRKSEVIEEFFFCIWFPDHLDPKKTHEKKVYWLDITTYQRHDDRLAKPFGIIITQFHWGNSFKPKALVIWLIRFLARKQPHILSLFICLKTELVGDTSLWWSLRSHRGQYFVQ